MGSTNQETYEVARDLQFELATVQRARCYAVGGFLETFTSRNVTMVSNRTPRRSPSELSIRPVTLTHI